MIAKRPPNSCELYVKWMNKNLLSTGERMQVSTVRDEGVCSPVRQDVVGAPPRIGFTG